MTCDNALVFRYTTHFYSMLKCTWTKAKLKLTTSLQIYYKLLRMYQCPMSLEALRLDKFKLTEPLPDMGAAIDILVKHYKHIDVKEVISAS